MKVGLFPLPCRCKLSIFFPDVDMSYDRQAPREPLISPPSTAVAKRFIATSFVVEFVPAPLGDNSSVVQPILEDAVL